MLARVMRPGSVAVAALAALATVSATASRSFADEASPVGPAIHNEIRFAPPAIKEAKLSNGIRVLFVERHEIPLFSAYVTSTIGAADGPTGVASVAARTAIDAATRTHWATTDKRFNLIGAKIWANADYRMTSVGTRALVPNLEEALSQLAELVTVTFNDADIVRVNRDGAVDDLEAADRASAIRAARQLIFPEGHPYHSGSAGTASALRAIEPDALRAFWSRAFTASNMTITLSGDVPFDRVMKALERAFGGLPKGERVPPSSPAAVQSAPHPGVLLIDRPGTTQARLAIVAEAPSRHAPDFTSLVLAASQVNGLVRERIRGAHGTSYGVSASVSAERGPGLFSVQGSVENGSVGVAVGDILKSISDVRDQTLTAEALNHVRMVSFDWLARSYETSGETASLLASQSALGLSNEDIANSAQRYEAVTPESLQKVAKERLAAGQLRVVVVGDAKVLKADLEAHNLGPVEVRSPTAN